MRHRIHIESAKNKQRLKLPIDEDDGAVAALKILICSFWLGIALIVGCLLWRVK